VSGLRDFNGDLVPMASSGLTITIYDAQGNVAEHTEHPPGPSMTDAEFTEVTSLIESGWMACAAMDFVTNQRTTDEDPGQN